MVNCHLRKIEVTSPSLGGIVMVPLRALSEPNIINPSIDIFHHGQMFPHTKLTTDSFMSSFIGITILPNHMLNCLIGGIY